ncbi:MAG: serine/threonine protein kinase [Ignavibacteriae bacterium]|nr:MAG: serine/threonine protein kinase [Ignavibacteriota bacterium]
MKKRLTVTSSTDNLMKIREFIKTLALKIGFNEEEANKIILAVDEACTNIMKHAYNNSTKGRITIYVLSKNNKFTVSITDEGKHFNSNEIKEPDFKEYYEEKRVGGLGMFLMKKLMDEVTYSQPNEKKNKVTLVKYLK